MTTATQKRLTRLHDLYFSETKPDNLKPVDMALVTYLILRQSEDHFVMDSQETLGERLGCDRRTIAESIKRLKSLRWITVEEQFDWNPKNHRKTRTLYAPSGLSVNLDKLPTVTHRAKRSAPSEDAKDLAAQHTAILIQNRVNSRYKQSARRFDTHQQHAAQRLLDEVGYSEVIEVINFALDHRDHQKAVLKSLYAVRQRLKRIQADMATEKAAKTAQTPHCAGSDGVAG